MKEADSEEDSGVYGCRVGEVESEVRVTVMEEGGTEEYPGGGDRDTQQRGPSSGASQHHSMAFLISLCLIRIRV